MLYRAWLSLTYGAIILAVLDGAVLSGQPASRFRAAVNYVELRVRVVDGKGNFVSGLKSADFEVTENGAVQTLDTVVEVRSTATPVRNSKAGAVVASQPPEESAYFILLDDRHLSADASTKAIASLATLIRTQLRPTDWIGIGFTSGADGQALTNNHVLALAALNRLHGQFDSREPSDLQLRGSIAVINDVVTAAQGLAQTASLRGSALVLVTSGVGCAASVRASDTSLSACGSPLRQRL